MQYDALLYGNGLTLHCLNQIKQYIPNKKQYLLNINNYMQAFVNSTLSPREEKRITCFFEWQPSNRDDYLRAVKNLFEPYMEGRDANIEYWFGQDIMREDEKFSQIKSLYPAMYYLWHETLMDCLVYHELTPYLKTFSESVRAVLNLDALIYTTNFDRFSEILHPQRLHGYYTKDIENYREFVFPPDSKGIFNFKQIWGYNDVGKLEQIKPIAEDPVKAPYFDFDFFFNSTDLGHLLIYGLGFQQAGYAVEMAEAFPKYSKPQHGCVIDGHILTRLSALQKINCLSHITFAYYSDADQKRYQDLVDLYQLKNVSYLPSANFNFKI